MIRITSIKDGFRRCGVAHPKGPTEYPDDRFSTKELKILDDEPMLFVEVIKNDMSIPELKKKLDELKEPYDGKAKKDELVALLDSAMAKKPRE